MKCLVHTSGSTGKPKPMLVEKSRMLASAKVTCDFLGLHEGDTALLCMSTDYIAGKMMEVRAEERGLKLYRVTPSNHPLRLDDENIRGVETFNLVAMVPSQVFESLKVDGERQRLMNIRNLIIGGGSISEEMERELRAFPNAVWSTYGMTETLSHIALRRISGKAASQWYTPFEGVSISLSLDDCLIINAPHVCEHTLVTNDIAEIHPDDIMLPEGSPRRFRIRGRKDNVICSGGIKLQIEEIEEQLRPYIHVPFCISKRKDEKFGEVAILVVEKTSQPSQLPPQLFDILPRYSRPKDIVYVDKIPLTETGKIKRFIV